MDRTKDRISHILLHPLYIKKYITNKTIYKFDSVGNNKSEHRLCMEIVNYVGNLYVKCRTLKATSRKLGVDANLLREFLLKADELGIIDYKYLKLKSKRPNLEVKKFYPTEIKSKKYHLDVACRELVIRYMKKYYSIKKVSEVLGIPHYSVRNFLFSKYNCNTISQLRKRMRIKRIPSANKIDKLKKVKEVYDRCLTLQKAAEELGITRERVRQLLREGERLGLFKYEVYREKRIEELLQKYDRNSLVKEIKMFISPSKICLKLNITHNEFKKLLDYFSIDYQEYRRLARMGKCLEEYSLIVDTLGHHPTTTEMNSRKEWRLTWRKISRLWGNIENFRKEFGIEKPKQRVHPNSMAAFRRAAKIRAEKMKLVKEERKRRLLNLIKEKGPLSFESIYDRLKSSSGTILRYLNGLAKEGLILRVGKGRQAKYIATTF